jgi:signal-transduction protein with cAMP-binding, CBS, and nucleotidyltransferase domain
MENKLFDFLETYMPLEEEEKAAITELALFRNYKKGAVLLREGQMVLEGFFVISGCVRRYYIIDGEEKTTAFFTEFESVTATPTIESEPAEYYLACVEDSLLIVSNPSLEKIIFENFPVSKNCAVFSLKNYWQKTRPLSIHSGPHHRSNDTLNCWRIGQILYNECHNTNWLVTWV